MERIRKRKLLLMIIGVIALIALLVWGLQLWQIKQQVNQNALYWTDLRDPQNGIVYIALGDSTAQAIGASDPAKGYVGLVASALEQKYDKPVQIKNVSKSGARLSDLINDQLPKIKSVNADIVTVSIGGNDIRNYDSDKFRTEINQICKSLPAGSIIATLPYFGHGQAGKDAAEASQLIEDCAEQHSLVVAPLYEDMEARGYKGMFTDYAADFFHPNDRGYRVWANAFIKVLPENLSN